MSLYVIYKKHLKGLNCYVKHLSFIMKNMTSQSERLGRFQLRILVYFQLIN